MDFYVMTLFPEMIESGFQTSITGRAMEKGLLSLNTVNIRDFSKDLKHKKVDDYTYGGGAGLLMKADPVVDSFHSIEEKIGHKPRCIYLTPQGRTFTQEMAEDFAKEEELVFLCGHYEGIDERALDRVTTDWVSIGDYVLTGGELPAMVMMDAISRLVPGVLHNSESAETESFENGLLEYPQYTRPEVYDGSAVPKILLSGDHAKVDAYRHVQSLIRTRKYRPDLFETYVKEHPDEKIPPEVFEE